MSNQMPLSFLGMDLQKLQIHSSSEYQNTLNIESKFTPVWLQRIRFEACKSV